MPLTCQAWCQWWRQSKVMEWRDDGHQRATITSRAPTAGEPTLRSASRSSPALGLPPCAYGDVRSVSSDLVEALAGHGAEGTLWGDMSRPPDCGSSGSRAREPSRGAAEAQSLPVQPPQQRCAGRSGCSWPGAERPRDAAVDHLLSGWSEVGVARARPRARSFELLSSTEHPVTSSFPAASEVATANPRTPTAT